MSTLLKAKRPLFITVAATAMVAAATISAHAATAGPGSTHIPGAAAPSSPAGPAAYSGHHDAPISLPSSLGTIESMRIPAGNYVIFAKLTVWNGQNIDDTLTCELAAGADLDRSDTVLTGNSVPYADLAAMSLNIVHHFSRPGTVRLSCTSYGVTATASWIKITAIRVGNLTSTALP